MRHFPSTQTLGIGRMQVAMRPAAGRRMQADALRGEWNEGSGVATLTGGADVRLLPAPPSLSLAPRGGSRAGATRLVGEELSLDTRARTVASDQPVVLTRDGSEVRAQTLRHDEGTGLTLLGGRVRGQVTGLGR